MGEKKKRRVQPEQKEKSPTKNRTIITIVSDQSGGNNEMLQLSGVNA